MVRKHYQCTQCEGKFWAEIPPEKCPLCEYDFKAHIQRKREEQELFNEMFGEMFGYWQY